jgi:hypothetical protein
LGLVAELIYTHRPVVFQGARERFWRCHFSFDDLVG